MVVSAVFSIASTKVEIVSLAILVLIYFNVLGFFNFWALHEAEIGEALGGELETIKKLLNFQSDGRGNYDEDYTEEGLKEIQKERKNAKKYMMVKFYISGGFQTIAYLIALFHLLGAISS